VGATKAAARRGTTSTAASADRDLLGEFEGSYGFSFDPFQRTACNALLGGSSVLVAAPTGAGKTVVGEFAAWLALERGGKTFYTTPIKALSNQKYGDLLALHGAQNVGLLTGDNSVNSSAPIVVMTTEVLRNMIYQDSDALEDLRYVVLDEVHYLQDRYRGAVWEEILIHLPVDVQIVSLSATISNAEEFAEWLQTLRGRTEVIIEEDRPVDIRHWYFASDELLPMFVVRPDGEAIPNPRGRELERRRRQRPQPHGRYGRKVRQKRARIPLRTEVIDRLRAEDMLPAIYFIFSRKGCNEAVRQCLRDNVRLTTPEERERIVEYADGRVADLTPGELDVLGYDDWIEGLRRGVAAHHAGMIPPFKETIEELFARGLVKAVFATETLSLGINMPARTVVIESVMKFTGERHEQLTPGQYTQFSGRAGRRGLDEVGHCVVLLQRFVGFDAISRLASTRTYPLVSSFQPSYNMAVNLVRNYDLDEAEHLVNSSFAQFQADRDVVRLERTRESSDAYLATYRQRVECERGDIHEYLDLVAQRRALESATGMPGRSRGQRVLDAIARLEPGDVFVVPGGKRQGRYLVLEVAQKTAERRPRILALSEARTLVRFAPSDLRDPPVERGKVSLPRGFHARDARGRRELARKLGAVKLQTPPDVGEDESSRELTVLDRSIERHPCHGCPELGRHLHFADRAGRLERELAGIDRRIRRRTGTLARRFELVLEILEKSDYVKEWSLTDKGSVLARVYNESDLLVVEALESGLFEELTAPELAAACSTLVYETRGPEGPPAVDLPTKRSQEVWRSLMRLWRTIRREEESRGLDLTREPDPGFAERAYLWASGAPLEEVLGAEDPAGDFVRSMKQLVDLMRQLEDVAEEEALRVTIGDALDAIHRGVVAYTSLDI